MKRPKTQVTARCVTGVELTTHGSVLAIYGMIRDGGLLGSIGRSRLIEPESLRLLSMVTVLIFLLINNRMFAILVAHPASVR
jgi:hypothetical protein